MSRLPYTEAVLGDFQANRWPENGTHTDNEIAAAMPGLVIGEALYDPIKHLPTAINPFSLMEAALNIPHVLSVLPNYALDLKIILDETVRGEDPRLTRSKRSLASGLTAAIERSLPGYSDQLKLCVLKDQPERSYEWGTEIVAVPAGQDGVTKTVADLCTSGLNFVISDCSRLNFASARTQRFESTVALKINHPFELELPANVGTLALGGFEEINTNNSRQLRLKNETLAARHHTIRAALGHVGISVASIIYDPKQPDGIDFDVADAEIANALRSISEQ